IRRQIRVQLSDPRMAGLGRALDSADICQSVLASFFVRAALGQFDLDRPSRLLKLLRYMTRNKVEGARRWHQAERRNPERLDPREVGAVAPPSQPATPNRETANRELLLKVEELLTDEERQLADLRGQGYTWPAVARQLGGTADARRMQFDRALDRVTRQLG